MLAATAISDHGPPLWPRPRQVQASCLTMAAPRAHGTTRRSDAATTAMALFFFAALGLFTVLVAAPAHAATIYLNAATTVAAGQRTGSSSAPYQSLTEAWSALPPSSASNPVHLVMSPGQYALPPAQHTLTNAVLIHEPAVPAGAPVQIVADASHTSLEGPIITLSTGANLTWAGVTFTNFDPTPAAVAAANQWTIFAAYNTSVLSMNGCTVVGTGSAQSLFRAMAYESALIAVQGSTFSSSAVDLNVAGAANLTIAQSRMSQVWAGNGHGIVNTAGASHAVITASNFTGYTDTLFYLGGTSRIDAINVLVTSFQCNLAQFGLASLTQNSVLAMDHSTVMNVDAATCAGGLFALYDQTSMGVGFSLFQDIFGRLVTGDSYATAVFYGSTLRRVNESPAVQMAGSLRSDSALIFDNCVLDGMSGGWNIVDRSRIEYRGGTVATNVVCPPSKSYVYLLAGQSRVVVSDSVIKSTYRGKACTFATVPDSTSFTATDVVFDGYLCPDGCISTSSSASTSFTRTNFTNNQLSIWGGVLSSWGGSHTLTNVYASGNSAVSVVAVNSGGATVTGSTFTNNRATPIRVEGSGSVTISSSTFKNNVGGTNAGGIVNYGSTRISTSMFTGNTGKFGGAIMHQGNTLTVANTQFSNNVASADGGALFLWNSANVQSTTFNDNSAKRGGAWFTKHNVDQTFAGDVTYSDNVPNDYASDFHYLEIANVPANNAPIASVLSGSTINATVQVLAHDVFGQTYIFGGRDTVLLVQAHSTSLNLTGERTKAVFTGSANWTGLAAFGLDGMHDVFFTPVQTTSISASIAPSSLSVSVPVEIMPCEGRSRLDPAPQLGPYFPSCQAVACTQGCVNGACTAAGQCVCNPGFEGIACQFPINVSDVIEWTLASPPYLATVGVRDGLMEKAQAVLPPGYSPLFRTMTLQNDTATSVVRFRFAVVDKDGHVAQADDLPPLAAYMADAIRAWSTAKSTSFYGFVWPPTLANAGAAPRTAASLFEYQPVPDYVDWREPQASLKDGPVAETASMGPRMGAQSTSVLSTLAFQLSIVTVPKVGVSDDLDGGKVMLTLYAACFLVHIASCIYLVVFKRHHRVVVTSNPWWILLATAAVSIMHTWLMLWTAAPTRTTCTAQLVVGLITGAMIMLAVGTKALHYRLIYENAVLCHIFGSSTKSHRKPLIIFGVGLAVAETVMVIAWLLNPATAVTSAVSISPVDGSYWHCRTAWLHPAAGVYAAVNGLLFLVAMQWIVKARNMPSPSQEPRVILFAVANIILTLAVVVALEFLDVSVVTKYLINSIIVLVTADARVVWRHRVQGRRHPLRQRRGGINAIAVKSQPDVAEKEHCRQGRS
ncbi:hypothetical protein AMAG_03622 [Allomyces macrogynus ATCC 38327]|uniref:G-protein coupled receptors family 3 profile domain-containing protein n=1 Tax=Allomyces macrogynus (strain ATCC 38327) TaxID=578462 RepID=A0A0L0SA57_ALLM3|nr:hypothetical protein AMAG_03622 [Allomyces macrogynus ATCC 38327]|eukprot:KNE59322.1 hypothetical protein AMAG_03622 [Allomyces macrogynus ATCC 38327]